MINKKFVNLIIKTAGLTLSFLVTTAFGSSHYINQIENTGTGYFIENELQKRLPEKERKKPHILSKTQKTPVKLNSQPEVKPKIEPKQKPLYPTDSNVLNGFPLIPFDTKNISSKNQTSSSSLRIESHGRFKNLPDVDDYGHIDDYKTAVYRLFNYNFHSMKEIKTKGKEVLKTYKVHAEGQEWFVKIVREDCDACDIQNYDSDWKLKEDTENKQWIKAANCELVLPQNGATFTLDHMVHLIVSYPWIPGETITGIIEDYFSSEAPTKLQLSTLKRAIYRYGQVLALTHLDPDEPVNDIDTLRKKEIRMILHDRNGNNEKYYPSADKIFLLDLIEENPEEDKEQGQQDSVESALLMIFETILEVYEHLGHERCGPNYQCITLFSQQFIKGYISSFHSDPHAIISVLNIIYRLTIESACEGNMAELCAIKDALDMSNPNKDR